MKNTKHKGLSLVELLIYIALLGLVTGVALSVLSLGVHGFNASKQVIDVTMADTDFATRISTAVRNSGTSFTIPQSSFTQDKFTAGWDYLGLMPNVMIPKAVSRTGEMIPSADALVYVEWYGGNEPDDTSLSANQEKIHNADGWFIMTILGHSYVDRAGVAHNYSLLFEPTDPNNHAAQSVKYTLRTGGDDDTTIETVLETVNAIQTVYQGSKTNPATAIAFRSFNSTASTTRYAAGTVVLMMDVSGSMGPSQNDLADSMKETAKNYLADTAAKSAHMRGLIVTFGTYADRSSNFTISNPTLDVVTISNNQSALANTIDGIKVTGSTNLGDGLRCAYRKIKEFENGTTYIRTPDPASGLPANPIYLIILSDGAMNVATVNKTTNEYYTGSLLYGEYGFSSNYKVSGENAPANGRPYFTKIARDLFKPAFQPYVFVINLTNSDGTFGMRGDDITTISTIFPNVQVFDAGDQSGMEEAFDQINKRISELMWAFNGPNL